MNIGDWLCLKFRIMLLLVYDVLLQLVQIYTILDVNIDRLRQIDAIYQGRLKTLVSSTYAIEQAGGSAIAVKADVADESAVEALFDATARRFGGVDVVVNAAGMMILGPLADFDLDDFDRIAGDFNLARQREFPSALRSGSISTATTTDTPVMARL